MIGKHEATTLMIFSEVFYGSYRFCAVYSSKAIYTSDTHAALSPCCGESNHARTVRTDSPKLLTVLLPWLLYISPIIYCQANNP